MFKKKFNYRHERWGAKCEKVFPLPQAVCGKWEGNFSHFTKEQTEVGRPVSSVNPLGPGQLTSLLDYIAHYTQL